MKNTILPIVILLACEVFARAGDPLPTMRDVIYGSSVNAVKFKRLEQLKELIKQGADINAPIGFNRMLKEGEDASSSSRIPTGWPLDVAVQQAQVDMVKLLLANGAKFHGGELAKAASAVNQDESLAMVTALIQAGADVNSPVSIIDKRAETATSLAQKTLAKQLAIVAKQQEMLSKLQSHSK